MRNLILTATLDADHLPCAPARSHQVSIADLGLLDSTHAEAGNEIPTEEHEERDQRNRR